MAAETIVEDGIDVLVVGAGLGGTGAAWEARFWGQDKKIVIAEKANIDRSGAVAQGLYAINCYMGTRWGRIRRRAPLRPPSRRFAILPRRPAVRFAACGNN